VNRTLVIKRAFQIAIIEGPDLNIAWQCDGFCQSESETGIEFSVDTENNVPFDALECFAFDLQNDPAPLHGIRPALIGNDGLSKKVRVPFLRPLTINQPFNVLLNCRLPGCITSGVQYYTASFSFEQGTIESAVVHLIFARCRPQWVKVYDCNKSGNTTLLNELRPFRDDGMTCEYVDMMQNAPGQSVRVYTYNLDTASEARQLSVVGA